MPDSSPNQEGAHLLIIPFPAIGHMFPLMKLAHQLSTMGLNITIMVTPKNLPHIQPLLDLHRPESESAVQTLVLQFPEGQPGIPDGAENLKDLPSVQFTPVLLAAFSQLCDPISEWCKSHPDPPVAIMSDVFFSAPAQRMAEELGIQRIGFCPLNAHSLHCCWGDGDNVENRANMRSWGLVFNTVEGLDSEYIKFYKEKMQHERVWAVGPLLSIESSQTESAGNGDQHPVIEWLDSCTVENSVVYVGFGTQVNLTQLQLMTIIFALSLSDCKFILAFKDPVGKTISNHHKFGAGFHHFGGQGIVTTEWIPQKSILQHRAVGAYLTHSGWNSVMEGLIGGVLLLLWPMQIDHYDHAKLLADDLRVAVRVCQGLETVPDATALAAVLTASTDANQYSEIRTKALELKKNLCECLKENGSSYRAVRDLFRAVDGLRKVRIT